MCCWTGCLDWVTARVGPYDSAPVTGPVRIGGGGARSPEWTQMLADCLQLPVEVLVTQEVSAVGAAVLAGFGVDVFADVEEGLELGPGVSLPSSP